jgi:hypothetical protein
MKSGTQVSAFFIYISIINWWMMDKKLNLPLLMINDIIK